MGYNQTYLGVSTTHHERNAGIHQDEELIELVRICSACRGGLQGKLRLTVQEVDSVLGARGACDQPRHRDVHLLRGPGGSRR